MTNEANGPTVLIVLDGHSMSDRVARAARGLFGDRATYLSIDVRSGVHAPGSYPSADDIVDWTLDGVEGSHGTELHTAGRDAGFLQLMAHGDLDDPTTAIITAARERHVDVVVIGASVRDWLTRLVDGFVERSLFHTSDFSVLVVAAVPETRL